MTILLAVALVFNLPAVLQRAIPDYTSSLQEKVGNDDQIREKLNLGGLVNDQNARAVELQQRRARTRKLWHRTGHQGHHRVAQHPR